MLAQRGIESSLLVLLLLFHKEAFLLYFLTHNLLQLDVSSFYFPWISFSILLTSATFYAFFFPVNWLIVLPFDLWFIIFNSVYNNQAENFGFNCAGEMRPTTAIRRFSKQYNIEVHGMISCSTTKYYHVKHLNSFYIYFR